MGILGKVKLDFSEFFLLFSPFLYTLSMQRIEKNPFGYRHPPLTGGQFKYTDYSIISGLSGKRGKKDWVSWADAELELILEDTPENRVWALSQVVGNNEIESFYILTLESDLIGVLVRMETVGVAFDRKKLEDIGQRIRTDIRKLEIEIYELV